ncbi:tRNA pseudouridine(55) synthase TruB [Pseudoxanthomonas wuyuanensis]|uniref:tRNA pseudouridine synthase B n=1 Tax=Pseudoxanthomonas wuyuanensis TaxID=1073196 RepID=A0A286D924_9GAMM|nr:tRNA pseudouridine(55) synthase TruB [Pseudoxanthomonas wuyuanensis]KAF1722095.1 tRNA pseudouridine(55) synthase TruB [Pseudoxanthomonas wuyuanensis]SOD55161.1 tRNA pseudouridine55 synthase [Pseudoxanthomonas wuyuanensis]
MSRIKFRRLDGILLLDKPQGISSNQALQQARRLFRAEKGGHTGSLDPLATGLLPLCFGEATKIAGLLLGSRKAYDAVAVLGATTDTDDADGAVLRQRAVPQIDDVALEAALAPLRGRIRQRAPIYSALKQGGEPLYAKARRGEAIEAPEREVEVHAISVTGRQQDRLTLRVECGSGTYVRSLVRDLGEALGCGAHVAALRRLWVEPFVSPRMFTLEQLQTLAEQEGEAALDACLLPIEAGLSGYPQLRLDEEGARRLGMGQRLRGPWAAADTVAVYGPLGQVLGLGRVDEGGLLSPQRLFVRAGGDAGPEPPAAQ